MLPDVFDTTGYYEYHGLIYKLPEGEPWWGTWFVDGRFYPQATDVRWWQQYERAKAHGLALRLDRLRDHRLYLSTRSAA